MTSGACKLNRQHIVNLRNALLAYRRADDRNYNDKERTLQLTDDLVNALVVQLIEVENVVVESDCGLCAAPSQPHPADPTDGRMSDALKYFTEAKVLNLEAQKRLAEGDRAALDHVRPKL